MKTLAALKSIWIDFEDVLIPMLVGLGALILIVGAIFGAFSLAQPVDTWSFLNWLSVIDLWLIGISVFLLIVWAVGYFIIECFEGF